MDNHSIDFEALSARIKDILYRYMAVRSTSGTAAEQKAVPFFKELIGEIPYFGENPQYWGVYEIPGDEFGRSVCWAMVRGTCGGGTVSDTVCAVHHFDVVDVEDFKNLADIAYSPDEVAEALKQHPGLLSEEAAADLASGGYLFGRGGCDMKGGGSIQLALLEQYSKMPDFKGNFLVIAVPDEENQSAGMRAAAVLLSELKAKYGLNYLMMINSEPHQRRRPDCGVLSEGTVGKLMPFFYVRGYLAHAGKVYEGINSTGILAEIMTRTEVNIDFADSYAGECAPAPTWLYARDRKDHYDVSMPLVSTGCLSVLSLNQTPAQVLGNVRKVCFDAMEAVIGRTQKSYEAFCRASGREIAELPWKPCVSEFRELYDLALASHGEEFRTAYEQRKAAILADIRSGAINTIEGTFRLVDAIYDYVEDMSPRVVYGLLPPYYPNVSNCYFEGIAPAAKGLGEEIIRFAAEKYGEEYEREYFFTGICDLSYINIDDPAAQRASLSGAMPLFGECYDVPFEAIKDISMGGINIGPWGKDFHKLTERVYMEDLYHRTPVLLDHAVLCLLG